MTDIKNYDKGIAAERIVAKYYLKRKYNFIAHRLRNQHGEIDLIFTYKDIIYALDTKKEYDVLVCVEVKYRRKNIMQDNLVSHKQRKKIVKTANQFLLDNYDQFKDYVVRYDIALLDNFYKTPIVFEAAFFK